MDKQPPLRERIVFLRRRSPGRYPAPRPDATRMRLTITTTVALGSSTPTGGYSNWEPVHATESEQLGSHTKAAEYPCLAGQGAYYRTRAELYYFHGTSGFKTDTSGYRYISCR